jgi:hypothetical protein
MSLFLRKILLGACAALVFPLLLSACGGDGGGPAARADSQLAAGTTAVPANYLQSVQQLYVAYFGRPADAGGLASFQAQLAATGAPTDIQQLTGAYNSNAAIRSLVNSFAVSDESKALYGGDTRAFVTAIYTNVLNRAPDADGLNFWVNDIDNKGLNRANASLAIVAGALLNTSAQGQVDARVVNNKITIATAFTVTVPVVAFSGTTAAAMARAMLAKVDQNTTLQSFQATMTSTIQSMTEAGPSIYAGTYKGSYDGSDMGTFTFTVSSNGLISGSGLSSVFGTQLIITGTLGSTSASPVPVSGSIGPFVFAATIDATTGKVVGNYTGSGVAGNITAQRQ